MVPVRRCRFDDKHRRWRTVRHGFTHAPDRPHATQSTATDDEEIGGGNVSGESLRGRPRDREFFNLFRYVDLKRAPWDRAVERVQDAQRDSNAGRQLAALLQCVQ